MEKLELKQLKGYLGTGFKVIDEESGKIFEVCGCDFSENELLVNDNIDGSIERYCLDLLKPLLLPLSALTEPLEDGSVPIVELIKIQLKRWNSDYNINDVYDIEFQQNVDWSCGMDHFTLPCIWFKIDGYCYEITLGEMTLTWVNEYLYQHHFDIYGLIPAGLAIDKRTVIPSPH